MTKVHIATSRDIGQRCIAWAKANLPAGAELVDEPEQSDVFISVLYARLLSEEFIAPRRCYNFHPGSLPGYRGAGAFSWAIINSEKHCGVTLHELDVDIDSGPLIEELQFPIGPEDTAQSLFDRGMSAIFAMFIRHFSQLVSGRCHSTPQDPSKARIYYRKDLQAARDLTKFARAFTFDGKEPAFYYDRHGTKIEIRY